MRIENLEVAQAEGERYEPLDDPMWEAQMARIDAMAEQVAERAKLERADDAEVLALLTAATERMNEANEALQRVLKVYQGI